MGAKSDLENKVFEQFEFLQTLSNLELYDTLLSTELK